MHWSAKLKARGACEEAIDYARTFDSFAAAWAACERGDWMFWILDEISGPPDSNSRRALVAAAVDCAALARKYTSGDTRKAFDHCQRTTRRYLRGESTLSDVRDAANAAYSAGSTTNAAAYAAFAAVVAVLAARAPTANAAGAATDAAFAFAAAYDAAAAARLRTLARCARIVRKHFPNPPAI